MKYGYTRTSTKDEQDDDFQRRALYDVGVQDSHIFSDQISGSKAANSRSGWSFLDERLRDGDELVIWRIDRIGRSMIDVISTVTALTEQGVALRSLTDGINPSTCEGRLMLNLMATFAEYERELIQERVQVGVNAARARGVRFGRPPADPEDTARKVRTVQRLIKYEHLSPQRAAALVGWSRATFYRHRKSLEDN
ncbi:recombinase family protein [Brevibacterium oceani]|uniref:recombinase family protein n=1 Tax=Brevibacterium oceani TaxID=358099 RepID=UPI001B319A68|nr:recombinase family protein [Brevibacterium oceani]